LEIYCQTLADKINGMGFSKILPIPSYIEVEDGYTKTFDDWDSQVKGEFDKQMICLKYPRRAHTVFDNVPWLREAWANPVFLSQQDAQESNISDGDTVLVSSPYGGKVIRKACVTGRLRPGVVGVPHGAWPKFDEATGIDVAGCDNTLTHAIPTGCGVSGFNSNIVKIEKYDGEQLADDVQQALRIPLKDGE
jgi:anaerobic dimethyl sulfoxide reductase subunit A